MDYLRPDGQLVMSEATHNVKKRARYFTFSYLRIHKSRLRYDDKFGKACLLSQTGVRMLFGWF